MKIALIACSKTKTKTKQSGKAKDVYIGKLFQGYYYLAKRECDQIYILSAKYGLLKEDDIISPYNKTLKGAREYTKKVWSYNVYQNLTKVISKDDIIYWYVGMSYKKYLIRVIKNKQIHYSKNLKMAYLLQKINKEINNESTGTI